MITVQTYDELINIVNKIQPSKNDHAIVFRGQCENYGTVVTSMAREGCHYTKTFRWNILSSKIANKYILGKKETRDRFSGPSSLTAAILQHYGYRMFFLDVTSDINVAIYFASNSFNMNPIFYKAIIDNHELSKAVKCARYDASKNEYGYIYVFEVPIANNYDPQQHGEYVDLSKVMPKSCRRIFRQQCGLIFSRWRREDKGDLKDFLVKKIRIKNPLSGIPKTKQFSQRYLFPDPNDDLFYKELLEAPFIQWDLDTDIFEKIIDVPEYISGASPTQDENETYRKLDKVYMPSHYFYEFKKQCDHYRSNGGFEVELNESKYLLLNADPILLLAPIDLYVNETIIRDPNKYPVEKLSIKDDWTNIFIELSPEEILYDYNPNSQGRGLWVIRKDNYYFVAQCVFEDKGFAMYSGMRYERLADGHFKILPHETNCPCDNKERHYSFLLQTLSIIEQYKSKNYSTNKKDLYHVLTPRT